MQTHHTPSAQLLISLRRRFFQPAAALVVAAVAVLAPTAVSAKGKRAEAPAAKCAPGESTVKVAPAELKLKCKDGFHECETDIPVKAQNCTGGFLEFTKLEMYEHDRRSMVLEFSPAAIVGPGSSWKEQIPWTTEGDVEAVVYYRPSGGSATDAARGMMKVVNRGLDDAKKSCERCNGTWGKYGINQTDGCNCKSSDAGKVCHDGDECKGQCLFVEYNSQGREVGKCSDSVRLSGCMEIVAKGALQLPVRLPPPRKLPTCL